MSGVTTGAPRVLRVRAPLMQGEDVRRLQQQLLALGLADGVTPDGGYGPRTAAAVRRFQQANGLEADGIAGSTTQAYLARKAPPQGETPHPTLRYHLPMDRGQAVILLQRKLDALGFARPGMIPGAFCPRTADALTAFQQRHELAADGVAGAASWAALLGAEPPPPVSAPIAVPRAAPLPADLRLRDLAATHAKFEGSSTWAMTPAGIAIDGAEPTGTGGEPATVRRIWQGFGPALEAAGHEFGVPVELLIATIATESSGRADATRLEPGYQSDAATPHRVSIGLTQTLISTARDALRNPAVDRAFLLRPEGAIRAGAAYIARQKSLTGYDPPLVACAYNAGSLRHNPSPRNRWRMVQYPIGTSAHADRFVAFFNDCFLLFHEQHSPAPSLVRWLRTGVDVA